ncbi:hypothetical protein [Archangium gephyra]|uniref:hypothetical protein n=1 Tax=Archangium gephyra TaxID=48 RepID=UPI0011C12F60|nr:hypothetical protein [Archangium gephyra]
MASRRRSSLIKWEPEQRIEQEALRHFKRGQIFSWLGDSNGAQAEFKKTEEAIQRINGPERGRALDLITEAATRAPRSRLSEKVAPRRHTSKEHNVAIGIQHILLPMGPTHFELRAQVTWNSRRLHRAIHGIRLSIPSDQVNLTHLGIQWIEVHDEYTATVMLTPADGVIFGHIHAHRFLDENTAITALSETLALMVIQRLTDGIHANKNSKRSHSP